MENRENRTDYDNAEKFEQIKELWINEEKLPVEVISAQIDKLINLPGEDEDDA